MHEEHQYLHLIRDVLNNGDHQETRNGGTKSIFGASMRFSLRDGKMPLLTTKRVAWKTCFSELQWFIRGQTSNDILKDMNVHIWDDNATREFLDSRGLTQRPEGDLGPIYGHQWRHFNATYENCHSDYSGKGIDQLQIVINMLKDPSQRSSRRMIVSAWNPCQLDEMALPPCHVMMQFYVREGKYLSCSLYQRSGDIGLGVPFNIASYSFLTHLMAKHCGLEADEFVYFLGNAHIYDDHNEALEIQCTRVPKPFPKLNIKKQRTNINDYSISDIEWIEGYEHHEGIKMKMVA